MTTKQECPHCGKMLVNIREHIRTIHPQTPEDLQYKEKEKLRRREYARNNRNILNKCNLAWRTNNPEAYKASNRKWADNNKERMKQYRIDNKEHLQKINKINRRQRINCIDCGVEISKGYLSQHKKFCCKNPEYGQKKNKDKEDKLIRNESNNIIKGKKARKPRKIKEDYKPISEMDKLRAQIKRAEQQKAIKRNLTIKNDVILEF
tara:strand:- start:1262 stop:1879 length:618 start_codon:yes stop_codon:yes gene_type:complete